MKVTLEQIRAKSPCHSDFIKMKSITDDPQEKFCVSEIIKSNDAGDTLWVLQRVCGEKGISICREFAIECALRCLPDFEEKYPDDKMFRTAIEAARMYLGGEVKRNAVDDLRATYDFYLIVACTGTFYISAGDDVCKKQNAWQEEKLAQLIKAAEEKE